MSKATLKPQNKQVIVITGATSGLGLATARKAAEAGACVFLIARGDSDLQALCEELQGLGARVAWAVADVADSDALALAADKCQRLFGGFDTWINNAGVSIFGKLGEVALEDQRRLFDTNYWGVVNGSLLAADRLKTRPWGGTIINIGSVLSDAPIPIQGVYAASKHAVKAFTNSLRMELMRDQAKINVSLVKPAALDTPYHKHARNITGQAMHNPQPVYSTRLAADTILYCASHPIREITVGGGGRLIVSFYNALPGLAEPIFARFAPSLMRDHGSAYAPYDDGLYDPTDDGLQQEVHYPMVRDFSVLAEVRKHPGVVGGVVAILAGVGLATVLLNQRTGPTRWESLRHRLDPRGVGGGSTLGGLSLRDRFEDFADTVRHGLADAGEKASDFGHDAQRHGRRWYDAVRKSSHKAVKTHGKTARRHAHDVGAYARDHAREGGALLALATIAAAVGAAALDARRPDGQIRKLSQRLNG